MKQVIKTTNDPIEYRLTEERESVILILNGGHCSDCSSPIPFEAFLTDLGYQLLIPSRPGYGNTPSSTGRKAEQFADMLIEVLDILHIPSVTILAISAGGRTALQLAGRHPDHVEKIVLQGALIHDDWPNKKTKLLSYFLFNPIVEKGIWGFFRFLIQKYPLGTLKIMMKSFTTLPVEQIIKQMSDNQQMEAIKFLQHLQSGSGFLKDIRHRSGDLSRIRVPTLIIHSKYDGSNPVTHAEYAANHIPHAELFLSEAESHLIWFHDHHEKIKEKVASFLEK
ncbi:alpha/beta fold hydrolase [Shimazuella alba]|uniref:Alpha/beta fold hydrolase n=1 Tax=Shimazuella alba TaxID=2690964 RepID=A0A6I4VWJ2_9BACL|nr:alpha/beta hydrolase [Shimazuella alba]MXQ54978.1 alpha/beta fold hydrolase [Shimazuella alba]